MTRQTPRRAVLLSALATAALPAAAWARRPVLAPLTPAEQALVGRASAYLQNLTQAKGRFVQTDARGITTEGTLYLKRPGKARFEYDPPAGLLVVSDGGRVSIANSRLKTFDSYPLAATPLSLFLAKTIRLDRGVVISRVARLADGFSITARDGKKEAEGQITLTFSEAPLQLIGWTVSDAQGASTRIRLTRLAPVSGLPSSLFVLEDPRPRSPGRAKM
jgi:outer membrane lipoprotein-sorting protein